MRAACALVAWLGLLVSPAILSSAESATSRVITCTGQTAACANGWTRLTLQAGQSVLVQGTDQPADVPVVRLQGLQRVPPPTDWQLTLRRLVLLDVALSAPASSSSSKAPVGPLLWPLNAFSSVGTELLLQDVRLVIRSAAQFKQFLNFFSAQPELQSPLNTTLHTDGRTFVHVTSWSSGSTVLQSVTLMTGPCTQLYDEALAAGTNPAQALAWNNSTGDTGAHGSLAVAFVSGGSSSGNGCNVFTADNATLVPLLLDQGLLSSREQLLVLLQRNASMSSLPTLPDSRIKLERPVVLTGLWTVATGINFEMDANQLDVTAPLARIAFSSLILENLPTGDATTTLVSAPYSPLATVNVYPIFCNRANITKPCTVLQNVTLVITSQTEMDYIGYMYSMFNSQAPGAKQLTLFYAQDLLFTSLNFTVGPGPDSITVFNATSASWRMLDVIFTTRALIFQPQPLPYRGFVDFEASKAAALVLQVENCADLKMGLEYRTVPSRLHVLLMRRSFSLAPSSAGQVSSIALPPTANKPGLVDGPSSVNMTEWPPPEPGPTCLGDRPLVAYRTQLQGLLLPDEPIMMSLPEIHRNGSLRHTSFATVGFAFTRNALALPSDQPAQLTFQNLVLKELPQGGTPDELSATAQLPYQLPPEAWTLLLWSINSTLTQRALRIRNSVLVLPEPEYKHLAALVRLSRAFVVELAGHPDALTFKDASEHNNHLHVGWYEGPGLMGENVTFILDASAQPTLSRLSTYWWPSDYQPALDSQYHRDVQRASQSGPLVSVILPAVLVPVVVVLLGAAAGAAVLMRRRHQQQMEQLRCDAGLSSRDSQTSNKPFEGSVAELGNSGSQSNSSSSRRSSKEGGSRQAHSSSCAVSASDTCELRVDVEQLMQHSGQLGLAGASAPFEALQHCGPASPAGYRLTPPGGHRSRLHGFFPVIEGIPVVNQESSRSSVGASMHAAGGRCASISRSSSNGAAHSDKAVAMSTPRISTAASKLSVQVPPQQLQSSPLNSPCGPAGLQAAGQPAAAGPAGTSGDKLAIDVASGLEKWRSVVSSTTMQLAERRLAGQAASAMTFGGLPSSTCPHLAAPQADAVAAAGVSNSCCSESGKASSDLQPAGQLQGGAGATGAPVAAAGTITSSGASALGSLALKRVLGRGSFGQVWLGTWRGIPVAVKIMHLPTNALVEQQDEQQPDQHKETQQAAMNPPHFAVMEAVLSSQCNHANVVTVYNYMLTPLLTAAHNSSGNHAADGSMSIGTDAAQQVPTVIGEPGQGSSAAGVAAAAAAAAAACAAHGNATLSGWQVKLLMELCEEGTLRTALDKGMFKPPGAPYIYPALALLIARDVAAAMLHLHSEGVVHGDLKAANVMLSAGGSDPNGIWTATIGRRLVAKVGDFGLALLLGPSETHASLTARGTPTHMSPELFMAGHVSKACDTYAYGVLLYEIITGQRAFSGVPLPLLPHEVAVKGVRPEWPPHVPKVFEPLQSLAKACWVQEPAKRPSFGHVLGALDLLMTEVEDIDHHPEWLASWATEQQPASSQQQHQQGAAAMHLAPGASLPQQQQHQQQRQWRHTVLHDEAEGPAGSVAAQHGQADIAGAQQRAGQMDWSEVRFEVPARGTQGT